MNLLRKPDGQTGLVHHVAPENAGWSCVGFDLWRLGPGEPRATLAAIRRSGSSSRAATGAIWASGSTSSKDAAA